MESAGDHGDELDDIFEATLSLEETHKEEGYREGFADGTVAGREEARQLGLQHGFAIGQELGFYRGCTDVWAAAVRADPAAFSARIRRGFVLLGELLDRYPLLDPEDESTQEVLEEIRLRFRAVTASLGVRLEYKGQPTSRDAAAGGVEF
ncbi:hypothetical protein Taro_005457 [Colocasia esculenta]|uniref:Essential protein Yae1 N-terminal domain-containing protein n=1 Tax=Colocasia esculenta TaxID=4460 RepID=A0A843TUL6_COLES|nr:hypothetical protein [Colocasia esculenta]